MNWENEPPLQEVLDERETLLWFPTPPPDYSGPSMLVVAFLLSHPDYADDIRHKTWKRKQYRRRDAND